MKHLSFLCCALLLCATFTAIAQTQQGHQWVYYGSQHVFATSILPETNTTWVSTAGGGLFRLDRNSNSIFSEDNTNNGLEGGLISYVFRDSQNKIWACADGLGIYVQENNIWKKKCGNRTDTSFQYSRFRSLDKSGNIWFTCNVDVLVNGANTTYNVVRYNRSTQKFDFFANYTGYDDYYKNHWSVDASKTIVTKTDSMGINTTFSLPNNQKFGDWAEDKLHKVWFVTGDIGTNSYIHFYYKNTANWTILNPPLSAAANDIIGDTVFDNQNNIYCITHQYNNSSPRNVLKYNALNQNWTILSYSNGGLPNKDVYEIAVGDDGHLWAGISDGANISDQKYKLYEYTGTLWKNYPLQFSTVRNCPNRIKADMRVGTLWGSLDSVLVRYTNNEWQQVRTVQGNTIPMTEFWVAPDQKVWGYNKIDDSFISVYDPVSNQKTTVNMNLPQSYIYNIIFDRSATPWCANYYGLGKFVNNNWQWYNTSNSLMPYDICREIGVDSTNNIWLTAITDFDDVMIKISPQNVWTFFNAATMPFPPDPQYGYGFGFAIDKNNIPWVGANGQRFKIINNNWVPFTAIADDWTSHYISYDAQGALWTWGYKGLYKLKNNIWTRYDIDNSEMLEPRMYFMTMDKNNNKWLFSNWGYQFQIFNERGVNLETVLQTPTLLSGTTYYDLNQNQQQDANEQTVGGQEIVQNSTRHFWSAAPNGFRIYSNPNRTDTLLCRPAANWRMTTDSVQRINTGTTGATNIKFGVYPRRLVDSLALSFVASDRIRCNVPAPLHFIIQNKGTTMPLGELDVRLDPALTYISSSLPYLSNTNGVLRFVIPNTPLNDFYSLQIQATVPTSAIGQPLVHRAKAVWHNTQGAITATDSVQTQQIVACSYDPNDKTARSEGASIGAYSLLSDALNYTIRFQNMGNDTAFTVIIRDTLHLALDANSFEFIGASHPVRVARDGRALSFTFNPIILQHAAQNDAASQGFISFRVRPKQNLSAPTQVTNTAYIYFDFNPAIVTNTAQSTLVDYLASPIYTVVPPQPLSLQPNPANTQTTLKWDNPNSDNAQIRIIDILGKVVLETQSNTNTHTLNCETWASGVYTVIVKTKEQYFTGRLVK